MHTKFDFDLQLFAEGGAPAGEGGGEATGESTADAGQSFEARLEALNVPKSKIRKGAYKNAPTPAAPAQQEEPHEKEPEQEESGAAVRKSWDEVKAEYKAEFDAEMQGTIKRRLKNSDAELETLRAKEAAAAPLYDYLASRYGLDAANLNVEELIRKFREDDAMFEEDAARLGTDAGTAKKMILAEQDGKRKAREDEANRQARQKELEDAFKRQQASSHFDELRRQGEELKKEFSDFDLAAAMSDEAFVKFTQPGSNISVRAAYLALHPEVQEQRVQQAAAKATEAVSASVAANRARPRENGSQAATLATNDPRNMTKEERAALRKRIYAAAYNGEKLPLGG